MNSTAYIQRFIISVFLLTVGLTPVAAGQSPEWLSGAEFHSRLKTPITSTWKQPLRGVVKSLRENFSICVFIDRRIDPNIPISLEVEDLSLEQTLRRLALTAKADISFVRNVVYLGPEHTSNLLATVAEIQAQNLKAKLMPPPPALLKSSPVVWNRLTNPRTVLNQDAGRLGLKYSNLEAIPFDLWNAGELAALPFAYRTTILLAGFDKTFQFANNSTVTVIDFPQQATLQKEINRKVSPQILAQIREQFPTLTIEPLDNRLTVQGRWEEIDQLERLVRVGKTTTSKPATEGMQVYTLTVENQPVKAIIQAIAQQEKLTVKATEPAQQLWMKRVSIEAKELRLNQLLSKVVKQAMLTFQIEDSILLIDTAEK